MESDNLQKSHPKAKLELNSISKLNLASNFLSIKVNLSLLQEEWMIIGSKVKLPIEKEYFQLHMLRFE